MIRKSALKLAQKPEINALERIAEFLSAIPKVERVVFFGSRARGDFIGSSDLDMLIVIKVIYMRRFILFHHVK